ncbi:MAG: hypothetical protein Q7V15_15020 [Phenylobacterium sp.]|uniref:hypothetical protein n=1 Tax=Phenylobacterium sp. TaxID=1871053 RepID=UPI002716E85D|nr:hypothetical protein [Phenylobacterium sp.]MDO8902656.1 hypothetical protein [Phenylobacterium sp.]
MLKVFLIRSVLIALPFIVWFIWAEWAKRNGRPMGATPWAWLATASALLFGLSLMITVVFQSDNRGEVYVPAEVTEGGRVAPGGFQKKETPAQ